MDYDGSACPHCGYDALHPDDCRRCAAKKAMAGVVADFRAKAEAVAAAGGGNPHVFLPVFPLLRVLSLLDGKESDL